MEKTKNFIYTLSALLGIIFLLYGTYYMLILEHSYYYVVVDNTKVEEVKDNDFKYEYNLTGYKEENKEKNIILHTTRVLKEGAYLKIKYMLTRKVISWEEVKFDEIPSSIQEKLKGQKPFFKWPNFWQKV